MATPAVLDEADFLIDLRPVHLAEAEDAATRIPIAMIGTFYKGKQKFTVSRADVKTMAENMAKRLADVVMDYEHASEFPEVAQGQPIPAAGWICSIDPIPDAAGIVWGEVKFTPRARGLIGAQEYRYISPAINWGVRDKVTGEVQGATLTSCALTNRPVLDKMPAIRLSDAGWITSSEGENVEKDKCVSCGAGMMCPKCDKGDMEKLTASERPDVMTLSEVTRDAEGRIVVASLRRGALVPVALLLEIDTQRAVLSEVDAAVAAGKITPAQKPMMTKLALSDAAAFRELLPTMGQQVDLSERGLAGSGGEGGAKAELDKIDTQLHTLAMARMKDTGGSYSQALKLIASENEPLNTRRTQLTRGLIGKTTGGDSK